MARLVVEGLWKQFGAVAAVAGVSFEVGEREFFTLLGPSGCGKTTTLRCVAGLEEPDRGEVRIGGRVVSAPAARVFDPPERRSIGMVFQNYAIWPHMTVFDNVAYPLRLMKQDRTTVERAVREVLALVALEGLERRFPSQLSGGQQQRVALARAMVRRPQLLLLDEPLSNLDAKLREQMRFELKELQRRMQVPILYVTHDQAEAMGMSDRIAVMDAGRIVQVGSPQEIYTRPADRFVADFIGLMNFIPGRVVGRDDARLVVEVLGRRVTVEGPPGVSGPVTLAVRPEDLELDLLGEIPVRVEVRSFVGNVVDYKVRADGQVLRVQAHASVTVEEGAQTAVRVRRALLFPGEMRA
jgi:iron(III) transport system ATP-binding protein